MLDLLLGNQNWRSLFLSGDKITEIIGSNDSLGSDKKGNFEYLLAKKLSDLQPKFGPIMFRGGFMPMAAFAADGAPQMEMMRGGGFGGDMVMNAFMPMAAPMAMTASSMINNDTVIYIYIFINYN